MQVVFLCTCIECVLRPTITVHHGGLPSRFRTARWREFAWCEETLRSKLRVCRTVCPYERIVCALGVTTAAAETVMASIANPVCPCANGGGACAVCARGWDGAWCCEKNAFDSQLIIRLLGRAVFRTWALPRVRVPTSENRNTMQRLAKGEMKGDLGILALPAKSGNLDSLAGVALGARNAVPNYHRPVLGPRCLAQLPSRCSASQFP